MKRPHGMQSVWVMLGAAAVILLAFALATSTVAQGPSEQVRSLALRWLLLNDDVGEEGVLEGELRNMGTQLEPVFLEALDKGPDSALLSELEQAAARRFEQNQELLKTGEGLGLSPEDLEAARSVTREQFIAQEKEDFILRYKSQAIAGLGITGTDKVGEVLQEIARDETSPLKSSAELALQKLLQR